MKKHPIPVNYDSSHFSLFGFIQLTSFLEAIGISAVFFYLLNILFKDFNPITKLIVVSALTVIVFVLVLCFSKEYSLTKAFLDLVKFFQLRRKLRFRPVKKRIQLKNLKNSYQKEDDEDEESSTPILSYDNRHLEKKKRKKKKPKQIKIRFSQDYVQEFLNLKKVHSTMIERKDGYFVRIFEIEAANFFNLPNYDQLAIVQEFERFLKIMDCYIQFKIVSKRSDLQDQINHLNKTTNFRNETNQSLLDLVEEVSKQLGEISKNSAYEPHYYLIVATRPHVNPDATDAEREHYVVTRFFEIEQSVRNIICTNGVKLIEHENEMNFLCSTLYDFYNRKSSEIISYDGRADRIIKDYQLSDLDETKIKLSDLVAPRGIDFRNRDYLVMDGTYYTFLTISDYPENGVRTGWISKFFPIGEGIDFDFFIKKEDKDDVRKKLNLKKVVNQSNVDQMSSFSLKRFQSQAVVESTSWMLDELEKDKEFYYVSVICTISASTLKDLYEKKKWVIKQLQSFNYRTSSLSFRVRDVFHLVEPLAQENETLLNRIHRNVLTGSVEAFYPFVSSSTKQIEGVPFGMTTDTRAALVLDIFNPISNICIFGTTGYGKSFLTMLLLTRLRMLKIQVYLIAPIKAQEYKGICSKLEGTFITIGPGSKQCINILEVRPRYSFDASDSSDTGVYTEISYLHEKIQDLMRFFDLVTQNTLSRKAKDLLPSFLTEFYGSFGITDDNDSIYIQENREYGFKKMPILGDLAKALDESEEESLKELAISLKKFTTGNLKYFNNQTNVDLDNRICIFDISKALEYKETRDLVTYIVQDFVWSRIREDRSKRKAIIYEEIWRLLKTRETAETIKEVFKTIRGYYGVAIGVTQNLSDMTDNDYSIADGILNNTLIQILLHNSSDEARKLKERFNLTDSEYIRITNFQKGEALFVTPSQRYFTKILATKTEQKLFESDGNKLNGPNRL